ncbi:uncharacterized protein L969DRAFT_83987 [Mixia osmundae IAM 14324]|uniref:Ion transport domain-containing protein n=1 Tax=Mixia osmundae (strain CBS 9802 / IAM 14324 / JCM 22182 / KY 12970) TaxID=764103 RepID=G7DZV9_MIXOS|nr:uncharacterized protein L969DRAFT_83987 [Mixia osmundae IAM 14324]KEI42112.1 hypothetical protein L969DRAFT_83987 [Mixia osmundae IAM 14324]GAA96119.1 hypothetical protein E5Q_02780 [Mixia osmundae IAM 14324]
MASPAGSPALSTPLLQDPEEVQPNMAPHRSTTPDRYADGPIPSRSQYYMTRQEFVRGVANRFVFSQLYIYLYLSMAVLSLTTVVLSLVSDCPGLAFYILEIVVNTAMILEVVIRLVAFGKQFWKSHFNTLDLVITIFCTVTVVVVFLSGCSAKGEEIFDTLLLVARNTIQFGRLAIVMRRSGKSIFSRVPAIDLQAARDARYQLDMDLEDEEAQLSDRMASGGDSTARSKRKAQNGQAFMIDSDEEGGD